MNFTGMSPEVARIVVDYYSTQNLCGFLLSLFSFWLCVLSLSLGFVMVVLIFLVWIKSKWKKAKPRAEEELELK